MEYQFGPWLPDVTDHKNPGLELCTNAIPGPGGYQPAAGTGAEVADIGAAALSARMFERRDGTRVVVCSSAGDLHVIVGGVVYDSSLTLALTAPVQFERYGDTIWATEKNGGTWVLSDIGSGTVFVAASNTIPSGQTASRIGDFLFIGNLTDTDASNSPYRIRWSPFNNPAGEWVTDIGTQSDYVDMPQEYGPVMGLTGWNFGLVLQRYGISRIQYTGGAAPFSKELVDRQRGCASTSSVVAVGDRVYFLSDDGFFFSDGGPAQSISRGRIWTWFLENVGQAYFENVKGSVDWSNRCVIWSIPGEDGTSLGLLYFNWETDNWSFVEQTVDCVFSSGKNGLSLEQVAALYPNLDTMTLSLDDVAFKSRGRAVAVFSSGSLTFLDGESLSAEFETGEFQVMPGRRSFISAVAPILTNADENTVVAIEGRDTQTTITTTTSEAAMGPLGYVPFNYDARYFKVRIRVPAGSSWSDAYGFQMTAKASGW